MFNKFFGKFSKNLGIDLGTNNTRICTPDRGLMVNEPSVVAVNTKTDEILAIGSEARKMLGKTPGHIKAVKPLVNSIISDFEVTEKMLKYFINKIHEENFAILPRPRVVITLPLEVTEVEKKAVEDATRSAGAREVRLVESIMAAAVGARLPVAEATATMLVNFGAGTTEIAVVSLGGVVVFKSLHLAGNELDNNIIQYIREEFNILIGEQVAENIKIKLGSTIPLKDRLEMRVRGRDLINGLPKEININDDQVREAIGRSIAKIVENIKIALEVTPPELVSDIYEYGIILSGGGALLRNLDREIAQATKIPVRVTDDPLTTTARGAGILLDNETLLKKIEVSSSQKL